MLVQNNPLKAKKTGSQQALVNKLQYACGSKQMHAPPPQKMIEVGLEGHSLL